MTAPHIALLNAVVWRGRRTLAGERRRRARRRSLSAFKNTQRSPEPLPLLNQHAWKIALTVCDGVPQISITVASQPLDRDRVTSIDRRKPG
jgi:hypothetical protein